MNKINKKIFIIATEQSGDNLGSNLIKNLKLNKIYNFVFKGIGGEKMIDEGLIKTNHISDFKSIGLIELFSNLRSIFNILNRNINEVLKFKPDIIITIDSPDFSFRFTRRLKNMKINCKFIHYS